MVLKWKNPLFSPAPFRFPETESMVLPDPSPFFSKHLLSSPLPTNSFFQNFVLGDGSQPEYIHPYLIKSSHSALTLSFPSRFSDPLSIYQSFSPDLSISASPHSHRRHLVSSFDDLSVTLDLPGGLRCYLVRGSPYVTVATVGCRRPPVGISISFPSDIFFTSDSTHLKHTLHLAKGRTYLCYSSTPLHLTHASPSTLAAAADFSGVLRFAYLPSPLHEPVLDLHSPCYPVSGAADFSTPSAIKYTWKTRGKGSLLLLAHPLHLRLLADGPSLLRRFAYGSIDGDLLGVVGRSWLLKPDPIPISWHSLLGVDQENYGEIISSLYKDVETLNPISTTSTYSFGKEIARAARLAMIAEEVHFPNVIPAVQLFLQNALTPWLEGSFFGNAFLYDASWGGLITKQGAVDGAADSGFGLYNAHHIQLGYFLYAIAVLSKLDPVWGKAYKGQALALAKDIVSLEKGPKAVYGRLRCFDLWKLHSWEGGLAAFADGRSQQGSSEAVAAYYAAALLGGSCGDGEMAAVGATLAAVEILAAETWWHVREGRGIYEEDFTRENRLVGVSWANKRDSGLWFAPPEARDVRLGIHVLPLLPVTELLFSDVGFVREMVRWAGEMEMEGEESWKGFVLAMEAVYDGEAAGGKMRVLSGFDEGNSLSNLLWWVHSRVGSGGEKEEEKLGGGSGGVLACCRKLKSCFSSKLLLHE